MGKIVVSKEIASKAIKGLIKLTIKNRGLRFKVKDFIIIPKVAEICFENGECLLVTMLNERILKIGAPKYAIFDVIGLHEKYVTQIELHTDGNVVYSPSAKRDQKKLIQLLEELSKAPEG